MLFSDKGHIGVEALIGQSQLHVIHFIIFGADKVVQLCHWLVSRINECYSYYLDDWLERHPFLNLWTFTHKIFSNVVGEGVCHKNGGMHGSL